MVDESSSFSSKKLKTEHHEADSYLVLNEKILKRQSHPATDIATSRTNISHIVTDIEGTTTPITFVHDVLFGYIKTHLESFLVDHWEDEECQAKVDALRSQADKDVSEKVSHAVAIPSLQDTTLSKKDLQNAVIKNIQWQMASDRKIAALKDFQGFMWRTAYASGEIKASVYEDVVQSFKKWTDSGLRCHIYSSGSVEAQKLLFKYSEHGDLTNYVTSYFDTVNAGPKLKSESYKVIAKELKAEPKSILFLSDNPGEIRAAKEAGLRAIVLVRPGNAPLPEELEKGDEEPWLVVKEFGAVRDWLNAESLTMDSKVILDQPNK